MKHWMLRFAIVVAACVASAEPPKGAEWELVFSDEDKKREHSFNARIPLEPAR